jgi:hypothetical protein
MNGYRYALRVHECCKAINRNPFTTFEIIVKTSASFKLKPEKIIKILGWSKNRKWVYISDDNQKSRRYIQNTTFSKGGVNKVFEVLGTDFNNVMVKKPINQNQSIFRNALYYLFRQQGARNNDIAAIFKKQEAPISLGITRFKRGLDFDKKEHLEIWNLIKNIKIR